MEVKTKYDIGDTLWTIDNNKVAAFKVNTICVTTTDMYLGEVTKTIISYGGGSVNCSHLEPECFRTKEELISWLANPYGMNIDNNRKK